MIVTVWRRGHGQPDGNQLTGEHRPKLDCDVVSQAGNTLLKPGLHDAGTARGRRQVPHAGAPEATSAPTGASTLDEVGLLTHVFLHLPDGIVMVDAAGNVVWGNPSAERMFGRSLADWRGQSGLALVHPDDREFVLRSLTSVQDKEVGTPIEIRIKSASGWRLVEIVGTTVDWGARASSCCVCATSPSGGGSSSPAGARPSSGRSCTTQAP